MDISSVISVKVAYFLMTSPPAPLLKKERGDLLCRSGGNNYLFYWLELVDVCLLIVCFSRDLDNSNRSAIVEVSAALLALRA